ncbi:MFS transporter [Streptomyces sp. NPDC052042]|uniref:MFS transporter n=1 Tax=Streptomyces sp. NPDC052042 TaxID=3365683 RepID=UPI0037D144F3
MTGSLRTAFEEGPMSRFQWRAVAVCVLLNALDGFDVLVMAFTGKAVSTEWELSSSQLGLLLSAGLVGMALGALCVAPWADRIGRRPVIIGCLAVSAAGMLLSAFAQTAAQLGGLRVLTGIGIGGVLASSSVIASEYASRRWRGLAVSLIATGYGIGATGGGLLAVGMIERFGWRSVFLVGGIATAAAVPPALLWLPESLGFLLSRRPKHALEKINALARHMGQPALESLPEPTAVPSGVGRGFRELLSPALRRSTLVLWAGFFLIMSCFYFVMSWTPTLLVEAGLSSSQGLTGGTLLNFGGIFGAAVLGLLASRFVLRSVLMAYLVAMAVLLTAFSASTSALGAAFALAVLIGVFVNGCVAGLYALTATLYDTGVRATGLGSALAIGRIGSILAPTVAGGLLDGGWSAQILYLGVAAIFVLSAALFLLLPVADRPKAAVPAPAGGVG